MICSVNSRKIAMYACCCILALVGFSSVNAQTTNLKPQYGAFYFDGWSGDTTMLTSALKKYKEREPIWGWTTSTPEIVAKQVNLASDAGLDFFNFCWYYNKASNPVIGADKLNNALNYYLKLSDKKNLKFCIMVTNNSKFSLKPADWNKLVEYWCQLFVNPNYVKVNNKPLLTFFSIDALFQEFHGVKGTKDALDYLRAAAKKRGLNGVSIAITTSRLNSDKVSQAGFDIITSYNDHSALLNTMNNSNVSDKSLGIANEQTNIWSSTLKTTKLQIIPTITLNWDNRPWAKTKQAPPIFGDYSERSITNSMNAAKKWIQLNRQSLTKEQIVFLYAWNEYGEGAWLTPSKNGFNPLDAIKKAIN